MTLTLPVEHQEDWADDLNAALTELDTRTEDLADADTALDGRVDTLETAATSLDGRLDTLEATPVRHPAGIMDLPETLASGAAIYTEPCFFANMPRFQLAGLISSAANALITGLARLTAGQIIHAIGFINNGSAVNTTRYASIYDASFSRVAMGSTATNATSGDPFVIPLSSPYTVPSDGAYYIGFSAILAHSLAKGPGSPTGANTLKPYAGFTQSALSSGVPTDPAVPVIPGAPNVPYFMLFGSDA